jgi:hypothetical protein
MCGGAPAAHGSLVAKSKSGERDHKKGPFSLLSGESHPPFVLEKKRTSLRKSTSPPVSKWRKTHLSGHLPASVCTPGERPPDACLASGVETALVRFYPDRTGHITLLPLVSRWLELGLGVGPVEGNVVAIIESKGGFSDISATSIAQTGGGTASPVR